ncbi:MAG: hypothetical protein HY718_12235, partial [Planctomycetes bacterium]|nr:hypothetical protein [Planctomycetota bacterium]
YEPAAGEAASLYEMGLPVVEIGDRWHVEVAQKVPLNADRDNVPPSYLQQVRVLVANAMASRLSHEEITEPWVGLALEDPRIAPAAVREIVRGRFGDRHVTADPSDPEANKLATAQGYVVIPPRTFNGRQWENIRRAGASLPAGQVTPSPKPYEEGGAPQNVVPAEKWTPAMQETVALFARLATRLLGQAIAVKVVSAPRWPFSATFGRERELTLNVGRLGRKWFEQPGHKHQLALLLHELAHYYERDHLSEHYAQAICRLGADLAWLCGDPRVVTNPDRP